MIKVRDCAIAPFIAAMTYVASSMSSLAQPLPGQPEFPKLLVEAVQASPGSLGVKLGRTQDGTNLVFAWFESKQALVTWYKWISINGP